MTTHILGLGMGLDSAALLTRWLLEPHTRPCALDDLVVLTAMTGDEYDRTEQLMTDHLLPLIRRHRVRYVQLSALGPKPSDGYTVLDDSHTPERMIMRGPWRLSDELRANGTLPESAKYRRKCSIHAKGQPLDGWIRDHLGGRPFQHVLGFAAEEQTRADRDESYTRHSRTASHPLIRWAWDRETCGGYLHETFGVTWSRSCCTFCPFQAGADVGNFAARWRLQPAAAVDAITLEHVALGLNPRMTLFGRRTARHMAATFGLHDAIAEADHQISTAPWAAYEVRRIFHPKPGELGEKGQVWRSVRTLDTGSQGYIVRQLDRNKHTRVDELGYRRAWLTRPQPPYPAVEHLLVAAPAGVEDKERKPFAERWARLEHGVQLPS